MSGLCVTNMCTKTGQILYYCISFNRKMLYVLIYVRYSDCFWDSADPPCEIQAGDIEHIYIESIHYNVLKKLKCKSSEKEFIFFKFKY